MKALKFVSLGLLLSVSASANILTTTDATPAKKIEGVSVVSRGTFAGPSGTVEVHTVGAALRQKYVGPLGVKAYVAQLLVSEPGKFSRNEQALASLSSATGVAIQLTMLRNIDKPTVINAFTDAFTSNGIATADANSVAGKVLAFVNASGDWQNGKHFVVVGRSLPNGSDVVTLENTSGVAAPVTITAPGALRTVLALWLGTLPANDRGLLEMKAALVSGAGL